MGRALANLPYTLSDVTSPGLSTATSSVATSPRAGSPSAPIGPPRGGAGRIVHRGADRRSVGSFADDQIRDLAGASGAGSGAPSSGRTSGGHGGHGDDGSANTSRSTSPATAATLMHEGAPTHTRRASRSKTIGSQALPVLTWDSLPGAGLRPLGLVATTMLHPVPEVNSSPTSVSPSSAGSTASVLSTSTTESTSGGSLGPRRASTPHTPAMHGLGPRASSPAGSGLGPSRSPGITLQRALPFAASDSDLPTLDEQTLFQRTPEEFLNDPGATLPPTAGLSSRQAGTRSRNKSRGRKGKRLAAVAASESGIGPEALGALGDAQLPRSTSSLDDLAADGSADAAFDEDDDADPEPESMRLTLSSTTSL